ncbi:hypothetical protein B0T14DRAFT_274448 [Immersiella caudata]|uniref:DUF7580 domain-containing protein n=1 Tax=Immersiella caudata TaxID=314043 RepID=A0AA39WLR8_9PEZI|nr:hypothetical protein B0T14DRAFT_274448 [Immersiella caudata]
MYGRLIRKICREVEHLVDLAYPDSAHDTEVKGATGRVLSTGWLTKWIDMRDHTHNLHCKLSHIWSYNCAAQQHHSKIRIALPIEEGHEEDLSFYYSFLLHGDAYNGQWRSVKIVSRPQKRQQPSAALHDRKGKKRARFYDDEVQVVCNMGGTPQEPESQIYDICKTVAQQLEAGSCMGLLSCSGYDYLVFDEALGGRDLVPLRQILPCFRDGRPIPTRQKRTIALSLASSLLLLYDTPWLPSQWSLDDVYMYGDDPTRLYRKQIFTKPASDGMIATHDRDSPESGIIDNQAMFCLAVALLELTFGAPLSNFQKHGGNADRQLIQLMTAKRLTKTIRNHEEERFASAVIRCMNPLSSSPANYDFSFGTESFRRQFIKDVLTPLYEDVVALRRIGDMSR